MALYSHQVLSLEKYRKKKSDSRQKNSAQLPGESSSEALSSLATDAGSGNKERFVRSALSYLQIHFRNVGGDELDTILDHFHHFFDDQQLCDWLLGQGRFMLDLEILSEARPYFILAWALFERCGQNIDDRNSILSILGDIACKQNHYHEAVFCYKKIIASSPASIEARARLKEVYHALCPGAVQQG